MEKDKNETAAERIALQRFCFLDSFAFDAGGQQIQPSVCRRALRPFGGQWEPFAEKSGTNAGGYGVLVTEGGMCIKITFEQASIELKVIICGAAYPVLVSILAACSGLLCDHDDPRLGGASMVGCSRSADQFYTIVFSLSKKSIAPQRA